MLETIREYGLQRRAQLGMDDAVTAAHTDLLVRRAEEAHPTDPKRWTFDITAASALLDEVLPVLHREQKRGNRAAIQHLAGSLGWVWWLRGRRDEGLRWLTWSLEDGVHDPRAGLSACRLAVDLEQPPAEIIEWADAAAAQATNPVDQVMATAGEPSPESAAGNYPTRTAGSTPWAADPTSRRLGPPPP